VLKTKLQNFLRRIGAYDRLKETLAYDCYQRLRYGRPIMWRNRETLFYRSLLNPLPKDLLIFDVGANRGQRTQVFVRLGARVIAIEPDALNQRLLTRRTARLFSREQPVTIVGKAVSDSDSGATLWIHSPGSGLNSLSKKWVQMLGSDDRRFGNTVDFNGRQQVETTTLNALIQSYGAPYYVKIDVEGHEVSVLKGLKRPVPFLSFEVNLPEFLSEGIECVEILATLAKNGRFNWYVDSHGRLALPKWLPHAEFLPLLRRCEEKSVEIFWRSGDGPALGTPGILSNES
jgi:FkbM family methyltransferase